MKTRLVLIFVLVAAAAAAAIAIMLVRRPKPPEPLTVPAPAPQQQAQTATPSEAVVGYLQALSESDFGAAYEHLSAASRSVHSYEEFAALCEESKGPSLDLESVAEHPTDADRVTVTVSVLWDPAEASFSTVREDGAWRVVFIEGRPWFPYP